MYICLMKKQSLIISLLFCCVWFSANGQVNLVPNPGFETITTCNFAGGGVFQGLAPPWDSPSTGSPDLLNTCCTSASWRVPLLGGRYQQAHSGNSFAGIALLWRAIPEFKEYLQIQLDTALIANRNYCVTFYVNLSNSSRYSTSKIGMYFSNTHTYISNYNYLNFSPQIISPTIITDTANWTLISGQYTAFGGENYVIIGNFFPDNLTDSSVINTNTSDYSAYYFVDDVSVVDCTDQGVGELEIMNEELGIAPNPAKDELNINTKNKVLRCKIYNVMGEVVLNPTHAKIDISNLQKGLYFIEIETEKGTARRKFVKQ